MEQRVINFDRSSKLRLLERIRIPVERGSRTSEQAVKAVLRVIDSHARDGQTCVLKLSTIAAEAGQSARSTASRAIAELRRLCLVDVTARQAHGKRASQYQIIWSNLRELDESPSVTADEVQDAQSESDRCCTDPGPMLHGAASDDAPCSVRCCTVQRPMLHGAASYEAHTRNAFKKPPPPPPSSAATTQDGVCQDWEAAAAAVRSLLVDWETALQAAQERVGPSHVLEIVDAYRAASGVYGPGALHQRLCRAHEDVAPEDGWPRPAAPGPECRRALACLAKVRRHLAQDGRQFSGADFAARFSRHLARHGLERWAAEALWREQHEGAVAWN